MGAFLTAVVVCVAVAIGAAVVLNHYQQPVSMVYQTQGVRI
jgi:hypothetical protein